ncbi:MULTISPECIES: RluA family pseudouridine synthase [unclassified Sphingopyxis]|jgi:23S rRNA pseudouridine1911/1915/1917 synthase|uniref:RluA family pseudouridine synthase n=1 Tax=unclassified Sphingopyxis TaxID=2614943 RepID=UPI0007818414|nr:MULTISPECIES: RluA family pseudouridine synthase [unclassified Sphingopyxis]USI77998.1 RluA family pseudouridine synthase [Sphingopyxis sp. USTB-05]
MLGDDEILSVTLQDSAAGLRLDRALAEALPNLSRERVKTLIKGGRVVDAGGNILWDPSAKAAAPATIEVRLPVATPAHNVAQDMDLVIAYEDEHLIVVDKPAGMVVHPAAGNLDGTMVNALLHHCAGQLSGIGGVARPGIVHRIDKDTSGLIVAAKHDKAHEGLAKQFAAHSIDRRYLAIATGRPIPANGTVDAALGRSSTNRKKMAVVAEGRGKHAITHYRTIEPLKNATLVECRLETGRTHQVRVHMAHIGHPLVGDPVYGRSRKPLSDILRARNFVRQALHAAHLGFIHPVTGNDIALDSELPGDMRELIDELRV